MTSIADSSSNSPISCKMRDGKVISRPSHLSPSHPCYGCGNYCDNRPCVDLCTKELLGWLKEIRERRCL
ncbi:UNVERIFIED_ORG: hypothetical protein B5F06_14300 [Lacrimispora saccharolytica]